MLTACIWEIGTEPANSWSGHGHNDLQHVLIGSMGGRLRSGNLYTYPDLPAAYAARLNNNAFLITLFHLMGMPSSEYSQYSNRAGGFGRYNQAYFGARETQPLLEMV